MQTLWAKSWLARKVVWGLTPAQRSDWLAAGTGELIDRLVAPDDHGIVERPSPLGGQTAIDAGDQGQARLIAQAVLSWVRDAHSSPRPLETFMEFFWIDFFGVSARSVRPPALMLDYVRLLGDRALGNFADLLRAVTVDGAMLQFLDGAKSTGRSPNENYGRELLELYSVGVGNFDETDVVAASRALTGWTMRRGDPVPRFVAARHDDSSQRLLGVDGVHDLDTTIAAVTSHPATAERVVAALADAILGVGAPTAVTAPIVERFARDLEVRPAVRSLLLAGVEGAATASLVEPVPWLVGTQRFCEAAPTVDELRAFLTGAGQIPLLPPNVGGYPGPDTYLSTSATIARFNLASALGARASQRALEVTADVDRFAVALGLVDGFEPETANALAALDPGPDRIAAALVSPDVMVTSPEPIAVSP